VRCRACPEQPLMSLVERPRVRRVIPPPLDLVIPLHPDDVDVPPFIPSDDSPAPSDDQIITAPAVLEAQAEPAQTQPGEKENPSRSGKRQGRRRSRRKSNGAATVAST